MEAVMEQQDERKISPADLWDMKVAEGMPEEEATAYVARIHGPPPTVPSVRPDVTAALQRERENPTGDWEAIPEGLKTAAEIGLSAIPIGGGAGLAAKGLMRVAPKLLRAGKVAGAVGAELPLIKNFVRGARAGQRVWQAGKAMEKIVPKAEGLMSPEASVASEPVALSPRRVQSLEERLAQMAEPVEPPSTIDGFLGNSVDNLAHAGSAGGRGPARTDPLIQQLEEIIGESGPTTSGQSWKPQRARGATRERDAYWAERMAKRDASKPIEEATLEDLLQLNLDHIKKGGSMKSASDALKIVRKP